MVYGNRIAVTRDDKNPRLDCSKIRFFQDHGGGHHIRGLCNNNGPMIESIWGRLLVHLAQVTQVGCNLIRRCFAKVREKFRTQAIGPNVGTESHKTAYECWVQSGQQKRYYAAITPADKVHIGDVELVE